MAKRIRNLDYIRQRDPRLYEALSDLIQQHQAVAQQVNGNSTGEPHPPPPIDGVTVSGQNGHFHIQIQHRAELYRGVQYYAEYADNPGFSNPQTIHMGDSRNHTQFLGNGTYYWRAYASYASSPPSAPAYHGGAGAPQPVTGGGGVGGPAFLAPQGSGTGGPGEGLSGPGPVPFISATGIPPKRGRSTSIPGGSQPGAPLTPSPATGLPEGMTSIGGPFPGGAPTNQMALYDTYANWTSAKYPPAQLPLNTTFSITDRNYVTYIVKSVAGVNTWVYEWGTYSVTQATIPTTGFNAAALGVNDAGLLIEVTDFSHVLKWGGAAWGFGPGDSGSAYFSDFPFAPTGGTWQLCDGSTVTYLKADGTTGSYTTKNLTGHYRKSVTAGADAIVAAVAPTFTGTPATLTGNVSAPTFTGNAATLTGSVSTPTISWPAGVPTFTGTAGTTSANSGAAVNVGAGAANAAPNAHQHNFTPAGTIAWPAGVPTNTSPTLTMNSYTPTGSNSAPTLTMNSYTPAGTISADGEPAAFKVLTYFRR